MSRSARDATTEELRETLRHCQAVLIELGGLVVVDSAMADQLRHLTGADVILRAFADAVNSDPAAASRLLHAAATALLNSQTLSLADLELKRRAAEAN